MHDHDWSSTANDFQLKLLVYHSPQCTFPIHIFTDLYLSLQARTKSKVFVIAVVYVIFFNDEAVFVYEE